MRPADCLPNDRRRYFHDGWVMVDGEVRKARVGDSGTIRTMRRDSSTTVPTPLNAIEPYYPEGACINTYNVGVYVARRARQAARRTASTTHYEILWYPPRRRLTVDNTVMWDLCQYEEYPAFEEAIDLLENSTPSVAVSPNLILYNSPTGDIGVIYQSHEAGRLVGGVYVPDYEDSCFTKLTRMELLEVNAQCL